MRWTVVVLALAACGDDGGDPPIEEELCAREIGSLPPDGPFADAAALAPAGCIAGGLEDLPGRWFVVDRADLFAYFYPRYTGSCEAGFREEGEQPEDHVVDDDGFTYYSYADGTILYQRQYFFFQTQEGETFEFANVRVGCMTADGFRLTAGQLDFEGVEHTATMEGTPFDRKEPEESRGLSLVGETNDRGAGLPPIFGLNVVVDSGFAYVVGDFGLDVIDVSAPATPRAVGWVQGRFNDVRVVRGNGRVVAFVSPIDQDLTTAIDVTNPASPEVIAQLPEYSHSLQVAQIDITTQLFLATYTDVVPHYDVTDPTNPVRIGESRVPGDVAGVHDLTVDGTRLYVNNTTAGFVAYDVSAQGAAVERGRVATSYSHASAVGTTASGRRVVLHGDEGMTGTPDGGAFLRVLEGDPASPNYMTEIGRYQSRPEVGIHNIELRGDKVYLSYYHDGVRVLDISTPEQPTEVAHFNTWSPLTSSSGPFEGAVGVRPAGGLIYVADRERGLIILSE